MATLRQPPRKHETDNGEKTGILPGDELQKMKKKQGVICKTPQWVVV